jgi:hypothetical protein
MSLGSLPLLAIATDDFLQEAETSLRIVSWVQGTFKRLTYVVE